MHKKHLRILAAMLLILLLAGCAETENEPEAIPPTQSVSPETEQTTPPQSETEAEEGDVHVSQNTRGENYKAGDGATILRVTVTVPSVDDADYAAAGEVINAYYTEQQDKHCRYAEQELYEYAEYAYTNGALSSDAFEPYSTEQFFETTYNSNGYLSFRRDIVESASGVYNELSVTSETFETSGGGLVTSDYMFFCTAEEAKARVLESIRACIEADESGMYYENAAELAETCFQPDSFYLTDEGIMYYYQVYELAQPEMGVLQFLVKYEDIKDIFALWQI